MGHPIGINPGDEPRANFSNFEPAGNGFIFTMFNIQYICNPPISIGFSDANIHSCFDVKINLVLYLCSQGDAATYLLFPYHVPD